MGMSCMQFMRCCLELPACFVLRSSKLRGSLQYAYVGEQLVMHG